MASNSPKSNSKLGYVDLTALWGWHTKSVYKVLSPHHPRIVLWWLYAISIGVLNAIYVTPSIFLTRFECLGGYPAATLPCDEHDMFWWSLQLHERVGGAWRVNQGLYREMEDITFTYTARLMMTM